MESNLTPEERTLQEIGGGQEMGASSDPSNYDRAVKEIAEWFIEHRRPLRESDMDHLLSKYFSAKELGEFIDYLTSPDGQEEFRQQLRTEKSKAEREVVPGLSEVCQDEGICPRE